MATTLTIRDESGLSLAQQGHSFELPLPSASISVRELIRRRVEHEVREYNSQQHEYFRGLVQPTDAEVTLNGFRLGRGRQIDAEQQCRRALELFERNGFMLLVDDRQLDDLDAQIVVGPGSAVTFLKLVPLVGG